jgi:hypothetical protein
MMRYILFLAVLFCLPTQAIPIFAGESGGIRVVLTDEPCTLKEVTNLPFRAVWTEKGKDLEGCWSPQRLDETQTVVKAYFSDLTVVTFPTTMFQHVTGV